MLQITQKDQRVQKNLLYELYLYLYNIMPFKVNTRKKTRKQKEKNKIVNLYIKVWKL